MPLGEQLGEKSWATGSETLLSGSRPLVRAIACTIVPDASALDESAWADFDGLIELALRGRPPALQRRLWFFLRLIKWLPVLRYGRPFTLLSPMQRAHVFSGLEDHPMQLIRTGFWGLRTLVLLGFYGRPGAARDIGYAPDARGWEARR